jgi:hypothetical protein
MDEGEQLPFDEIIPPTFEPTTDPTAIGLKPLPNLRRRIEELKQKYIGEIDIQEVNYEELHEENA